jgi:cyclin C
VVADIDSLEIVCGVEGNAVDSSGAVDVGTGGGTMVTPAFLTGLLTRMREAKLADMAHPANGRHVAINKMLERTQAAG